LLSGKLPDPVRVVSTIREQHRLWKQGAEENRTQPTIVRFTGREGEMDRHAIGTAIDDGLPSDEGVFLPCSFWLVDAYVLLDRNDDARRLFERLLTLCNDVGLLSEEYDPGAGRQLGNFPQALSHIALVNSAFNLCEAAKPAIQRSAGPIATPSAISPFRANPLAARIASVLTPRGSTKAATVISSACSASTSACLSSIGLAPTPEPPPAAAPA
jgi:hypothetical protein